MNKRKLHFSLNETTNYDLFKMYDENRDVNLKKVRDYKKSIKEEGLKQPINVKAKNGKLYITDGQHRYIALKELGYHIIYIIDFDKKSDSQDIITINSNRQNTDTKAYIKFYAQQGYEEYVKLQNLYDKYPKLKSTLINEIFIRSEKPRNIGFKITVPIRTGRMKVDYNQGKTILDWLSYIYHTNEQKSIYQSKTVRAFKSIYYNNDNFNINHFCNRLQKTTINIHNNEASIVKDIKEIYNKYIRDNEMYLA